MPEPLTPEVLPEHTTELEPLRQQTAMVEEAERLLATAASNPLMLGDIVRRAEAARVLARQVKLGTAAINSATAVKLRAEVKLADAIDAAQAAGEVATKGERANVRSPDISTLTDLDLDRRRLAEARQIRRVGRTSDDAEQQIAEAARIATEQGREFTRSAVIEAVRDQGRIARAEKRQADLAQLDEPDDMARLDALGIKLQPYDVWNFSSCHDAMGAPHPGRIPGELVCHVLHFFTEPGAIVVDPMAGSGTTLDACRLMGRQGHGFDIDLRHGRADVTEHDLSTGWPDVTATADLIFWDPPYYDKMDHGTIGAGGYVEGSISGLDPDGYLDWLTKRFESLYGIARDGARLAFLMSDWDAQNAKRHGEHQGLFEWDYADRIRDAGWRLARQIQCPLPTQQVHPDIVLRFRESRRLARLGRYLLVAEK